MQWIRIEAPKDPGPFHWSRKFFHMLGLLIPIFFYLDIFKNFGVWADPTRTLGLLLIFGTALLVMIVDLLRFRFDSFNRLFLSLFGRLMKEEEAHRFNAVTPYLISCGILFLFCAREVVTVCSIFLMVGDPAAAYIGSRWGRIRFWNNKSLEGMLAFVLLGMAAALAFLCIHSFLEPDSFFALRDASKAVRLDLIFVIFMGALFAGISEFFSSIHMRGLWDDNLLVPLGAVLGIFLGSLISFGQEASLAFWFDAGLLF